MVGELARPVGAARRPPLQRPRFGVSDHRASFTAVDGWWHELGARIGSASLIISGSSFLTGCCPRIGSASLIITEPSPPRWLLSPPHWSGQRTRSAGDMAAAASAPYRPSAMPRSTAAAAASPTSACSSRGVLAAVRSASLPMIGSARMPYKGRTQTRGDQGHLMRRERIVPHLEVIRASVLEDSPCDTTGYRTGGTMACSSPRRTSVDGALTATCATRPRRINLSALS